MTDKSTEKKLSAAQRKSIETLMTTGNTAAAADAAGVNRSTVYKWQKEPHFIEAMRHAEADAVAGLSRTLAGLGELAAASLRDALASDQKISTRLRASEIVISNLLRLRELVDLESRLTALEEITNAHQSTNQEN
ncbi:MAG: hypothetical protein H6641_15680 [Caldilineaceae bacterium]|nr:hypothetical protein [Caldilineaceae bacterium]